MTTRTTMVAAGLLAAASLLLPIPSARAAGATAAFPMTAAPVDPAASPTEGAPASPAEAAPPSSASAPFPAPPPTAAAPAVVGPVEAAPQPNVRASADVRGDSVAAARMVGTEMFGASSYFLGYGTTISAMAALYGNTGPYPAPGIQIGLLAGGVVNLSVGATLFLVGRRRMNADDAWLDARSGRRARFEAKARRRGLYLYDGPVDDATADMVRRGRKVGLMGVASLMLGGAIGGVGVGVSPISPGAGVALTLLGTSGMITGAVLAARGKKMAFRPHDFLPGRGTMAMTPTLLTSPDGRRMAGVSLVARW